MEVETQNPSTESPPIPETENRIKEATINVKNLDPNEFSSVEIETLRPIAGSLPLPETAKKNFDFSVFATELRKQVKLAGPLVIVSLLQYSLQLISVMFIGHIDELALASSSLATSFASVTGFSFMLGMGGALETFCGQAYGAKQYHLLGIYLQRAIIVFSLLCIPIAILWTFTGQILELCGQDFEISTQAGAYSRWLILSIVPYAFLQCQLRFLQTQSRVKPLMLLTSITSLIHVFGCWILVTKMSFGSKGAAISSAISYWVNVLAFCVYIKLSPACKNTWRGLSKDGRKGLIAFLSLGIPSALMQCLEFWAFQALVLISGRLPNPKLETSMMSISLTTTSTVYRVPYGLGSAVSTRVSNELGAGRPDAAKLAVQIVCILVIVTGVVLNLALVATRSVLGYLFTNEKEVVKYFASIIPILAISNFFDGIQGALSGVARGCGLQKICTFVNLGAYYVFGLPSAIIFGFLLHMGGKGLWFGIIIGCSLQGLGLIVLTIRTNWEKQARKASGRVHASTLSTD